MKIGIIGGGASGVLFALKMKRLAPDIKISIFESQNKLLGKVARSGNGRCNFGNLKIESDAFNHPDIIKKMLLKINESEYLNFLEELGLFWRNIDDRLYPYSLQASDFCMLLEQQLFYHKIEVHLNTKIEKVVYNGKYYLNDEEFDIVIIAIGSTAGISEDTGSHYQLINSLGLPATKYSPALVGLKVKEDIRLLQGQKAQVRVSAFSCEENGEVIFKEDGISGICVMNLAHLFTDKKQELPLKLDFFPDYNIDELIIKCNKLIKIDPKLRLHNLFLGAIPLKIRQYINRHFPNDIIALSDLGLIKDYISSFKNLVLTVCGNYGFINAQVTQGGVIVDNLSVLNKKYPNLYCIGEVTDIHGKCGGYNLWYAFSSAIYIATSIFNDLYV